MEDEPEQLDWGNEEDELQMYTDAHRRADYGRGGDPDDAEDAVSLGGDEEDDPQGYVYQSRSHEEIAKGSAKVPVSHLVHYTHQSSQESQSSPPSSAQKTPIPHGSPQQSPLRSHSFSKLTHALPPKPVTASVPFMHHSDPSIFEATAMSRSRSDRDKKANGSANKPLSSGEVDPLPPDWEIRHSRSGQGVYYYNVRTYKCTWTHPANSLESSLSRDEGKPKDAELPISTPKPLDSTATRKSEQKEVSRPARSDEDSPVPLPVLSYQDRHYRPGADNLRKTGSEGHRRDERPSASHTPRSFTPPASPKPERARSPLPRPLRQDHNDSSRPQSARHDATGNDVQPRPFLRDEAGSQTRPSGRHWDSSRNPPSGATTRQTGLAPNIQPQVIGTANFEQSASRGPHSDANLSSTTRYRSPPPHLRRQPPSQAPQLSGATVQATAPRHKSRFDPPDDNYRGSVRSQGRDDYAPAEVRHQHDQPVLTNTDRGRAENTGRSPDDLVPNNSSGHRSSLTDRSRPPTFHTDRRNSLSAPVMPLEQSHSRQKPHLALQSTGLLEGPMTSSLDQRSAAPTSSESYKGSGVNVQGPMHAGAVPSAPRSHPQPMTPHDTKYPEFPQGSRAPPSGPSRGLRDPSLTPNESSTLRDRDVLAVDVLPPSRASFRTTSDTHIRAGSGMYADREQDNDLPKGPRAMSSKSQMNAVYPPPQASPSSTLFVERSVVVHERSETRFRERSPPHASRNEGWERRRDGQERQLRSDGFTAREESAGWRPNNARWDDSASRRRIVEQDVEGNQPHRAQNRRSSETFRPVEPSVQAKTFTANDTSVGNRASHYSGSNSQPEIAHSNSKASRQAPLSAGVSDSGRERDSRVDFQTRESYEPSSRFNTRITSEESFRNTSSNNVDSAQYHSTVGAEKASAVDFERRHPMAPESYPNSTSPTYSRRDSARVDAEPARFEPHEKDRYSAPRIWTPRQPSPVPAIRTSTSGQSEYRRPSPPPARDAPIVSPTWESSFRSSHRPPGRHQYSRAPNQFEDGPRQPTIDEPPRRQQGPLTDRIRDIDVERPNVTPNELDKRLGDRYDDRYEAPYRLHTHTSSTSNLPSRRDHEIYPNDVFRHPDHHSRPHAFNNGRRTPERNELERRGEPPVTEAYHERPRVFDGPQRSPSPQDVPASTRSSKSTRVRRFGPPIRTDSMQTSTDVMSLSDSRAFERRTDDESRPQLGHDRANVNRRGTSLLDRLSLDTTSGVSDAMASASLRDRVMIPAKRDRDEMQGGADAPVDVAFELDDANDNRRNKRRNGKSRRGKGRMG